MSYGAGVSARAPAGKGQFRLTMPVVPEHDVQAQFARVLALEIAPAGKVSRDGVCWYSVDHANYAGEVPGIRIERGIIAGILDMFILFQGAAYFVEIKSVNGELSEAQKAVATAVLLSGGSVAIVTTVAHLLEALDAWGIPRRKRVKVAA